MTVTDVPIFLTILKKLFSICTSIYFSKQHSQIADLEDAFDFIKERNDLNILKKYPVPKVGNPEIYKKRGISYTFRWIRHHWIMQLYKNFLLKDDANIETVLDIGSNYGQFCLLFKKTISLKNIYYVRFSRKACRL